VSDKKYSLILASKSPRRKQILSWIEVPFTIIDTDINEVSDYEHPVDIAKDVARKKGLAAYELCQQRNDLGKTFFPLIVSSDTIVSLGDKLYGKPNDADDAKRMLLELAGKTHRVVTGVAICRHDIACGKLIEKSFHCVTDVTFTNISPDILARYIRTGESLDKAGSYGIQGQALTFISSLNGSYSNVVGFPIDLFLSELQKFLVEDWENQSDSSIWRNLIHH